MRDSIVIGGGPAGLSAAINLRSRGKDVLLISSAPQYSGLWKAPLVDNYPAVPGVSGKELLEKMTRQAISAGVDIVNKRVLSIMPASDKYFVSFDNEVAGTRSLIIACGIVPSGKLEGEAELLGKGVSYCATCDGMLYRGKRVVVTGDSPETVKEAEYLSEIGCKVVFVGRNKPETDRDIEYIKASKLKILGNETVAGVEIDGSVINADGVFVLRKSVAPGDFMPGLNMDKGYITVDRNFKTNLDGVWAAGDCTGKPFQIAKAVGEGQVAALNVADYLENMQKKGIQ